MNDRFQIQIEKADRGYTLTINHSVTNEKLAFIVTDSKRDAERAAKRFDKAFTPDAWAECIDRAKEVKTPEQIKAEEKEAKRLAKSIAKSQAKIEAAAAKARAEIDAANKSDAALAAALKAGAKEEKRIKKAAAKAIGTAAVTKGWSAKRHHDEENDELQCTHCGEILSFDDFANDRTNKLGKQNHCKSCIKEHAAARKARKAAEASA